MAKIPRTTDGLGRLSFSSIKGGNASGGRFTISPAAYAKGKVVVTTPSESGFKTRAARLAASLGGKYVKRSGGYVMGVAAAERFSGYYKNGVDASIFGSLERPSGLTRTALTAAKSSVSSANRSG